VLLKSGDTTMIPIGHQGFLEDKQDFPQVDTVFSKYEIQYLSGALSQDSL